MSQCYRVQLKSSVSRVVQSEDSVIYPIELTPILPEDEMREILDAVLEKEGWKECESGKRRKVAEDGAVMTIDLEKLEVEVTVSAEKEVIADVEVGGAGESQELAQRQAKDELRRAEASVGDQIASEAQREVRDEVRGVLAETEEARTWELNQLLQEVYAESLKRKAGRMGDVLEVAESTGEDGNYELVIRVAQ